MRPELLVLLVISVISMICGFGLLLLWNRNRHARPLSLLLFSSALWALFIALFLWTESSFGASIYVPLYYISSALIAVFGMGFALSYLVRGRGARWVSRWLVAMAVVAVVAVVAFCVWPDLLFSEINVEEHVVSLNILPYIGYVAFISGCFLLATVFFIRSLKRKNISLAVRVNLRRLIFLWLAGGSVAVLFNLWLPLFGDYSLIWVGPLGMVFGIFIAFMLATTTEYFSPIKVFARGLIDFLCVVFAILGALNIFALLYNLAPEEYKDGDKRDILYGVATIGSMGWFWAVMKLNRFIARLIDANEYNESEILKSMSQIASEKHGLVEFFRAVRHTLDKAFGVEYADIVVFGQRTAVHVSNEGLEEALRRLCASSHKYGTVYCEDVRDRGVREALAAYNIEVVTPVVGAMDNKIVGVIVLSPRKRRFDRYYGETLAKVSAVLSPFIQSAVFYEEINSFNVKLKEQIREKTQELRESNKELMKLDGMKDDLLSIASHNLRTPLTGIIGYADMLREGDFGKMRPEQQVVLEEVVKSGKHMSQILSDFLDVTRIDSGRMVLKREVFDLAELVTEEVGNLREMAAKYGRELSLDCGNKKIKITGDELHFRQVVVNLIDNAIYYGKKNVEVSLTKDGDRVVFLVKDDGIGVPKEDMAKIFDKMYRATNAGVDRPDGTGIGLFVVKNVVEASGGRLVFESVEGEGSVFGFEL